jgi:outer membrane protein assembly factor BamB
LANGLYCLDSNRQLAEIWRSKERVFREYASLIASRDRILITTLHGALILAKIDGDHYQPLSELQLFEDEAGLYSHPALVGSRLYVRGTRELVCLDLEGEQTPQTRNP